MLEWQCSGNAAAKRCRDFDKICRYALIKYSYNVCHYLESVLCRWPILAAIAPHISTTLIGTYRTAIAGVGQEHFLLRLRHADAFCRLT